MSSYMQQCPHTHHCNSIVIHCRPSIYTTKGIRSIDDISHSTIGLGIHNTHYSITIPGPTTATKHKNKN